MKYKISLVFFTLLLSSFVFTQHINSQEGITKPAAPKNATYITKTPDGVLTNEQALSTLSTGIMKVATGTGVISVATAGTDYIVSETDPTVDSSAEIVAIIDASPTFAFTLPTFGFSAAGDQWKINQTSATGTEWVSGNPTGLIWINDDRTGTTVDEKEEATIVIDTPAANYGLYNLGATYLVGATYLGGSITTGGHLNVQNGYALSFGASSGWGLTSRTAYNQLTWALGTSPLIMGIDTNQNFDHGTTTNPTIFIHSATAPDTDNTQWLSFAHDQTNGVITTGKGNINLTPVAGSNITLDGTIAIDAGVVTGATSITSTTFVGALTGTASGNYVPGGTDVAVADGGTGKSSWTQYLIPYADTTTSFSQIAIGTAGQVLVSGGAGVASGFSNNVTLGIVSGAVDAGGATSFEIPNVANPTLSTAGQIAINTTDKTLELHNGINQIAFPTIHIAQGTFDLKAQYAIDPDLWLIDLHADSYPHGIYITKIYVDSTVADPTTELNANLNYCDATSAAFPGANPTLIKLIDTTTGNFSDAAVNTAIPTGKSIYITMDADPTDATTQYHIRIHYYIPVS